ncbi:hypothetical protein OK016_01245 [Vibrio chagasii]|nr:hypothetical protein [Vibrio chagasii]
MLTFALPIYAVDADEIRSALSGGSVHQKPLRFSSMSQMMLLSSLIRLSQLLSQL